MPSFELAARQASVFDSWQNLGCYTDWDMNARTLTGPSSQTQTNTPQKCVETCAAGGFSYAGVEWGVECFCGNEIAPSAYKTDGECTMACSGNGSLQCGAGNRINIYFAGDGAGGSAPAALADYNEWTHDGCFTDQTWARALSKEVTVSGSFTPQKCLDACQSQGFNVAGVEYANECFCGSDLVNNSVRAADQSTCNMACAGNSNLLCGGPDRLNVYRRPGSASQDPPAEDDDDSECAPNEWEVLGCYSDAWDRRALSHQVWLGGLTIEKCLIACDNAGFSYAGVEYGNECFCGNEIGFNHSPQAGGCESRCEGNNNQICGGGNRINIYQFSDSYEYPSNVLQSYKSWYAAGCLTDNQYSRSLPLAVTWISGGMTVQKCIDACEGQGATYAGLEYAKECFCGWGIENGGRIVDVSDGCSMACEGDADHLCGGGNRLNLYQKGQ